MGFPRAQAPLSRSHLVPEAPLGALEVGSTGRRHRQAHDLGARHLVRFRQRLNSQDGSRTDGSGSRRLLMILVMVDLRQRRRSAAQARHDADRRGPVHAAGLEHAFLLTVTSNTIWLAILFPDRLHHQLHAADELGRLQLRHARRRLRLRAAHAFWQSSSSTNPCRPRRWLGVALICIGVLLVSQTKPRTTEVCNLARRPHDAQRRCSLPLFILCSTGGEIIITRGMKIVGEPTRLRPREILIFLGRALQQRLVLDWYPAARRVLLPLAIATFLGADQPGDPSVGLESLRVRYAGRQVHSG